MRIAELHHQHGENQTAHDLCKLIVDMPVAESADYYEPNIYSYTVQALLAETQPQADNQHGNL